MKFEEASKELDEIIAKLEKGGVSFNETMKLFMRADELIKICDATFKEAKGKITIIKDGIETIMKNEED